MSGRTFETSISARRGKTGMTLVEVMVSLVVLSFGLLGVAALQVRAITESSGGQHLTVASGLARNRVEELSRLDWDAAVLNDSVGAFSAGLPAASIAGQTYVIEERIDFTPAAPNETIKAIEVRVTWNDTKRGNRSVVLASARLKEIDE